MKASAADNPSYDVVVVGGRVAGSLTASLFARHGLSVLVLDRARFPSPTLSTHFFRGAGLISVLERAGCLGAVLDLGAPPLIGEYNYDDNDGSGQLDPPQDPGDAGYCLSVRREPLDETLLAHAAAQGCDVRTSTTVRRMLAEYGRVGGVELADGTRVRAGLVVGADGRRSTVAAAVGAIEREVHPGRRALYYRYVAGMLGPDGEPPVAAEFSLLGDQLAYVFPSDAGLTCVALSVNLDEYERIRHDAAARFDALFARHTALWPRYATAARQDRIFGSGPEPDVVRQAAGPGWALVGDSGIHQDPWSGAGMDTAAVSAAALVDCVLASGGTSDDSWSAAYERSRDDRVLDWFHDTVAGAADLSLLT